MELYEECEGILRGINTFKQLGKKEIKNILNERRTKNLEESNRT